MQAISPFSKKIPINWNSVEGSNKEKVIKEENNAEMKADTLSNIAKQ